MLLKKGARDAKIRMKSRFPDRKENLWRVLEFERLLAPSAIQNFCRKGKKGSSYGNLVPDDAPNGFSEWLVTHLGFDWNVVAKRLNENLQKILFQEENAPPFEVPAHDSWIEFPKFFSRRARSEVLADFLAIPSCHIVPQVRQMLLEEVSAPAP